MSCSEFKTTGYLFLSGELSRTESGSFRRHLRECPVCRRQYAEARTIWKEVEALPYDRPASSVKKAVLERARRGRARRGIVRFLGALGDQFSLHPAAMYGASLATAAVFLFFVMIRPMMPNRAVPLVRTALAWQDDFMAEADYLDKELDRLESGVLLADYSVSGAEDAEEEWLSPMGQDLDWIRGKVENLVKTIYGI